MDVRSSRMQSIKGNGQDRSNFITFHFHVFEKENKNSNSSVLAGESRKGFVHCGPYRVGQFDRSDSSSIAASGCN